MRVPVPAPCHLRVATGTSVTGTALGSSILPCPAQASRGAGGQLGAELMPLPPKLEPSPAHPMALAGGTAPAVDTCCSEGLDWGWGHLHLCGTHATWLVPDAQKRLGGPSCSPLAGTVGTCPHLVGVSNKC